MTLIFTLSMPGNNAWNGRWSGQGKLYAVVRKFSDSEKMRAKLRPLINQSFGHSFGDGWYASVRVTESCNAVHTKKVKRESKGFCGYEWMIENILDHGTTYDAKKEVTV